MKRPLTHVRSAVALASMFVLAGSASAGTFTIQDLADNVSLLIQNPVGIFDVTACFTGNPEACSFSLTPPAGNTAPITMSIDFRTGILTEGANGSISDWLVCNDCSQSGASTFSFSFSSDTDGTTLNLPQSFLSPINVLAEDGTRQGVMTVTYVQGGNVIGTDVLQIQSDVADVPEPSTWMMALSGLGALGCALRRRKQA